MNQTWKILLGALAFIALPVLYAIEFGYLNRTFYAGRMMMIAVIAGLCIGVLLGFRFQKSALDAVGRMRTFAVCIVVPVLTLPLLTSLSNRLLSFHPVQKVQVEFVEESPRYSSRFGAASSEAAQANSYFTFFYKDQELLKIQTRQSLFPEAQRGDTVILPIKKGLWGFEIVAQP